MTVQELIKKYWLFVSEGNLGSRCVKAVKRDGMIDEIKAKKEEIFAFFAAQEAEKKAAAAAYKAKIDAIEGLSEIQAARRDVDNWRYEFERSFRDAGGMGVRKKPEYDFHAMYAKYPRAAAYLKAEEYAYKSNYRMSEIGAKALDRIVDGEDYTAVIADMNRELDEYTNEHMWD